MKNGFTLMEILIVVALLVLLSMIILANIFNQIVKARDAQRKTDLNKIQKSLEEYYDDNQTYPPNANTYSDCGNNDSSLYLSKVPCDPTTQTPYLYIPDPTSARDGYVLCATLQNHGDPDITSIGCDPVKGCGWSAGYNYCVSSGMLPVVPGANGANGTPTPTNESGVNGTQTPTPTPATPTPPGNGTPTLTPTPSPISGAYGCVKTNLAHGDCNWYADPGPSGGNCPVTYQDSSCTYLGVYQCDTPANRCKNY